jgi:hypothetical protein
VPRAASQSLQTSTVEPATDHRQLAVTLARLLSE